MQNLNTQQKIIATVGVAAVGALVASYIYHRSSTSSKSSSTEDNKKEIENLKGISKSTSDLTENTLKAQQLKEEGNLAFKNGNYEEAIRLYTEALQFVGSNESHLYYSNRSAAYFAKSSFKEAANDGRLCISLKPQWSKGYYRLGKAFLEMNDFDGAYVNFSQALRYEPSNKELMKLLEETSQHLGVGELDPRVNIDDKVTKLYLRSLNERLCNSVLKTEYEEFFKAVESAIGEEELHKDTGTTEDNSSKVKSDKIAIGNIQAVSLSTSSSLLETVIPYWNRFLRNELLAKLLSSEDSILGALQVIVNIFLEKGKYKEALVYAEKATTKAPNSAPILLMLVNVMIRQPNTDFARILATIRKALQLDTEGDILIVHTYATVLAKLYDVVGTPKLPLDIHTALQELKSAGFDNPKTNHFLIADAGIRIWFKFFEDPLIQQRLLQEEEETQRQELSFQQSYQRRMVGGVLTELCSEPFFLEALSRILFNNPGLEKVLCPFRTAFLSLAPEDSAFELLAPFIHAIALQCFRNNYCWTVSEEERKLVRKLVEEVEDSIVAKSSREESEELSSSGEVLSNDNAENPTSHSDHNKKPMDKQLYHHLSLISLFRPLSSIRGLDYDFLSTLELQQAHKWFVLMLKKTVIDRYIERCLVDDGKIEKITEITENPIGTFYDHHLSSLWDNAGLLAGKLMKINVLREIEWLFPNTYRVPAKELLKEHKENGNSNSLTRVFVAGCGSGAEVFQMLSNYENLHITGVDISIPNLAYAVRQNAELLNSEEEKEISPFSSEILASIVRRSEQGPCRFVCGDLTRLNATLFDDRFDLVVAQRVLDRFSDPLIALERLTGLVRPGGVLRLSVHSHRFIGQLAQTRSFLTSHWSSLSSPIFDRSSPLPLLLRTPTDDEILEARTLLFSIQDESQSESIPTSIVELLLSPASYSLNEFADLLFCPQIVGLSFRAIEECLSRLNLRLLGFEFPGISQETILLYRLENPDDPYLLNCSKLEEFENKHPDAFRNIFHVISFACQVPE